jgi:hypothetical protein
MKSRAMLAVVLLSLPCAGGSTDGRQSDLESRRFRAFKSIAQGVLLELSDN